MLPLVRKAVDLDHKITVEGQMLATLHIIRMVQLGTALPTLSTGNKNETAWRSMFEHCYAAVSQATGYRCQQFSPAKHPELASSLAVYNQCLPVGHSKPTRPTWLKPVSLHCVSHYETSESDTHSEGAPRARYKVTASAHSLPLSFIPASTIA